MTFDQIKQWIAEGESNTVEFKQSTAEKDRACRTLCAFANGRGGHLLFGISPSGALVGQTISDRTLQELAREFTGFEPPLMPATKRLQIMDGREVLVVSVERSRSAPISFRGVPYERILNTTHIMPRETYQRLLLEQMHSIDRWENAVAEGWSVSRLETRELVLTLEESIRRGRIEDPGTREPMEILRGLGLLSNSNQISRAAVVLFCRDESPMSDFPQLLLKIARFIGTTRNEFVDNRQFHGNAFSLMRRAERFLIESLPVAGRIIPDRFEREDTPLVPFEALREALANAIVHRDYSISGDSVSLAIFEDRLEITSIGELHFGLTPEALFRDHESMPWNPMIARTFYRRGIIETWGRGTLRIMQLMQERGLNVPTVHVRDGAVTVVFSFATEVSGETSGKTSGKVTGKTTSSILQLLLRNPGLTVPELADKIGRTERTIERAIRQLREAGRLARVGPAKGGTWRVYE